MRTLIIGLFSTLLATVSFAIAAPAFAATSTFGTYTWNTLKIGAGGFIIGIDIAPDGTKVIRTDTYGAYVWNAQANQWDQLVTTASMPASDTKQYNGAGVYEIQVAASNSSRFYMLYNGYVYRSDNKGASWIKTSFAKVTADSNDSYRTYGQKMDIDPLNADVVYVGTSQSGLWESFDAGMTWTKTPVPASKAASNGEYPGMTGILVDKSAGAVNNRSKIVYAGSWGNGVWRSVDGGSTWTQVSGGTGGPTKIVQAAIGSDGIYYATDEVANPDTGWKYQNGVWTSMAGSGNQTCSVAVDPLNPAHLVVGGAGGTVNQSWDHGATWSGYYWTGSTRVATDVPWLAWTNETYMSNAGMVFDPSTPNKLWFAEGIGVWYFFVSQGETSGPTFYSQSAGIEQLVADDISVPPGGKPVVASWDRPLFYVSNPDTYPSTHGPDRSVSIDMGWSVDWASSNPSFLASLVNWGVEDSSYSTDGGQTWTKFSSFPTDTANNHLAGGIAVSTPQNIVVAENNNGHLYYTKDGGITWALGNVSGVPATGESGWGWAYYFKRDIIAADRVLSNTFYVYNYGPSAAPSVAGLWRSVDGGANWTLVHSGAINYFTGYHAKLKSVPGQAGNLFFTPGPQGGPNDMHPGDTQLMRSTDGGVTWIAVPNVYEVTDVDFGKALVSGGYPAIYIAGWVNQNGTNIWGVWRSDDNAQSWIQIGDYPLNSLDQIVTIAGDMSQYGVLYVGFSGSGYAYGVPTGTVWGANAVSVGSTASVPTVSLVAGAATIAAGSSTTLTWSSTNATACASNSFTVSGVSGFVSVAPTATTTYSMSCSGSGGSASASVTISVNTTSTPSPAPTPAPSTFGLQARVKTTSNLNVRAKANTKAGKILCTQPAGSLGTITQGPATNQGYMWWYVKFDTSCSGWVVQTYLTTSLTQAAQSHVEALKQKIDDLLSQIANLKAELQAAAGVAN